MPDLTFTRPDRLGCRTANPADGGFIANITTMADGSYWLDCFIWDRPAHPTVRRYRTLRDAKAAANAEWAPIAGPFMDAVSGW